ncbi:hypothetical protein HBH98_179290 [Parastagonospora nodorum]|nr:hypothetical protein HBH53_044990 [Parastagonospora nodorum]KAH3980304.1 hypothetical protein HBH52_092170 [Parastagonospora nodorum]KAH4108224.1 hypothetical protein HBH46_045080 [Parastagonospora nodorum]KAH4294562.1 hypothetical protein HBI02_178380 [Parastagonospora nodorum]KAH4306751.1 hypothetical protein HBI01_051200 [Parastagonospora nodorum]
MSQAHIHTQQPSRPVQQSSPQGAQSPSTLNASPMVTPGASTPKGHVDDTGRRIQGADRARASIACTSCRRSKTKCNNKGQGTTCIACAEKNKFCDYSNTDASTTGVVKRRESTVGDIDTHPRKRKRPIASALAHHPYDVPKTQDDVLHSPFLTAKVWEELFDIYEKHFASDFPFLHRQRFLKPLHQPQQSIASRQNFDALPRPPHSPPLLLGFLTLTARYHPELVQRVGTPIATAEYWAKATQDRLGSIPGTGSLERAQAMLFLGYHRWTDLKGENGWHFIGLATRYVQNLGYQKDENYEDTKKGERRGSDAEDELAERKEFIDREIRRRTFWSCFIMDRYTSCVSSRVQMINVNDIKTQLPCNDGAFNTGTKVRTRWLGESDEQYSERRDAETARTRRVHHHSLWDNRSKTHGETQWEVGKSEAALSLYIQTVDYFGKILAYSIGRGRRTEEYPPWDEKSTFYKLVQGYEVLRAGLPQPLTLTTQHTYDHIYSKTSRDYVMIHALHTLCTIALYREYIAFAPWGKAKPEGPLDEPRITQPLPDDMPDYWIDQARKCFGAGKDFAELLIACDAANALVDSTIAGWATYIVGWCAMYCHMFPNMDPDRALDSHAQPNAWDTTNKILHKVGNRFTMPGYWQDALTRLHDLYRQQKHNWKRLANSPGSTSSTASEGGGLYIYESQGFQTDHLELGNTLDKSWSRKTRPDDWKLTHDPAAERHNGLNSPTANFKIEDTPASTPHSTGFNSINGQPTSEAPSVTPSSRMPWNAHPSPSVAPVRPYGSSEIPQSPHGPQITPNPSIEGTTIPSPYRESADVHFPPAPTHHYAPREALPGVARGPTRPTTALYGWSSQVQQAQFAQQMTVDEMRLRGQPSVAMGEFSDFQRGDYNPWPNQHMPDFDVFNANYGSEMPYCELIDQGYLAGPTQ